MKERHHRGVKQENRVWGGVLSDAVRTLTTLDWLMHRSHVLNIRGGSYRLREKRHAGLFSSHHLLGDAAENGNDNYTDSQSR